MIEQKDYCGQSLVVPPTDFDPKSRDWNSIDYLKDLRRSDINLSDEFLDKKRDFFLHAAYTEFDAENLCRFLETLDFEFSPEFKVFEKKWRRDEWNHYIGFRYIYSIIFNESETAIARIIESRPYDFSGIQNFFKDEFSICLLIAYDEILTTKSYASEHQLYKSFGNPQFYSWIKEVTRDESYHFNNVMEVIGLNHSDRIEEIWQ